MNKVIEIITANEKIYPYTDKRIEQNKSQTDEEGFIAYLSELLEKFYIKINEMIICLQSNNLMIHQKEKLEEQLSGMTDYYFNKLPIDAFKKTNWEAIQGMDFKLKGKQGSYINPKDFTKDYVLNIVESLTPKRKKRDYKKQDAFKAGIEFANGSIYTLLSKGDKVKEITENVFGKKKYNSFYPYVYYTIEDNNNQKNIYKRTNAKSELKELYNYLLIESINVSPIFKERLKVMGVI